jgi:putative phosphonate catabolism associated alcohol dehydrogenase
VTRAAVWTGSGVQIREVALPRDPDVTLVRVRLATVCGSDVHTVSGRRPAPCPSVLGHEAVGEVVAPGGHPGLARGDRIVWSVTVSCGHCARCRAGRTAKCHIVRKVGHEPFDGDWPLSGAYAEHIVLPAGVAVAPVPDGLDDRIAAPAACATATVMATLEAAGALAGRRVLVCGAGMLGVTAAAACALAGADVQITDLEASRVARARDFGAAADAGERVDVAIDFSGATPAISAALARIEVGGVLVLAGSVSPSPPLAVDPETVVRRWLTVTGVHNYEPRHLAAALLFLDGTRAAYPWSELVAEPVRLHEVGEVLGPMPTGRLRASVAP